MTTAISECTPSLLSDPLIDLIEKGVVTGTPPSGGGVSRIKAVLTPASMVTTLKNTVDHVVTEYGVADMRGRSISQRAAVLIAIAHPRFRDDLEHQARELRYL